MHVHVAALTEKVDTAEKAGRNEMTGKDVGGTGSWISLHTNRWGSFPNSVRTLFGKLGSCRTSCT